MLSWFSVYKWSDGKFMNGNRDWNEMKIWMFSEFKIDELDALKLVEVDEMMNIWDI